MNIDEVRGICVVGAGTMGSQIAQQAALWRYPVWLVDSEVGQLERAMESNRARLQRRVDKGTLTLEEMEGALQLVRLSPELDEVAPQADVVIEAVVEK